MINEAIGVYADGVASAEEIDVAMRLGANHPMGPLQLGDLIGLDVCLAIMEVLQSETGDPKYRPHPMLKRWYAGINSVKRLVKAFLIIDAYVVCCTRKLVPTITFFRQIGSKKLI